jgi:hypothetical protein
MSAQTASARNVFSHFRELIGLRGLAGRTRHAQIELFTAQLEEFLVEFGRALRPQFLAFHQRT